MHHTAAAQRAGPAPPRVAAAGCGRCPEWRKNDRPGHRGRAWCSGHSPTRPNPSPARAAGRSDPAHCATAPAGWCTAARRPGTAPAPPAQTAPAQSAAAAPATPRHTPRQRPTAPAAPQRCAKRPTTSPSPTPAATAKTPCATKMRHYPPPAPALQRRATTAVPTRLPLHPASPAPPPSTKPPAPCWSVWRTGWAGAGWQTPGPPRSHSPTVPTPRWPPGTAPAQKHC